MKLKAHLTLFMIASLTLLACDTSQLEEAVENFGIVIGLDPIATTGTLLITDAETGELIRSSVSISFSGASSNAIIDMYSDPIMSGQTETGVFNFGLSANITPTADTPILIDVEISSSGYLPIKRRINISQVGNNSFSIDLIDKNNPPEGVEINNVQLGATNANGQTQKDISLSFSSKSASTDEATGASIFIASGSTLIGQNGTTLNGNLSAEVIFYDETESSTVSAISNNLLSNEGDTALVMLAALDLSIRNDQNEQATSVQNLKTGGSTTNNLQLPYQQANHTTNSTNTNEYIVDFILNATTYPELQSLLRLAIISPTTAERIIIYTIPKIQQLPDGRVQLRYLLSGELFRTMALVYFSANPCNETLFINRNGNNGMIDIEINERGFKRTASLQSKLNSVAFRNVTKGTKTVQVKLPHTTFNQNIDICGTISPEITLPRPPSVLIDANIQLNVSCPNPDENIGVTDLPASTILYREVGAPSGTPWRVATNLTWDYDASKQSLTGASCVLNAVELGKKYTVRVLYDNNEEETTVEISGTRNTFDEIIDQEFCF